MLNHIDSLFDPMGLRRISGYYLPTGISGCDGTLIYVAQLAIKTEDRHTHGPIKCANLDVWLEQDPIGQKVHEIAKKEGYHLAFQMIPHEPGHTYLNCFIPSKQPTQ